MNVLFITADQWRGECLSRLDHPIVRTPNLDQLAKEGVQFTQHFVQATPCAPSRTSLHTGTYLFNHRCVVNGTPVASQLDNWAHRVRAAGYNPSLFGYTDTAIDPRGVAPSDPRLTHYSEPLPGLGDYTPISSDVSVPWVEYLKDKGYSIPDFVYDLYKIQSPGTPWRDGGEAPLPLAIDAEDHETHFMVDQCINWIGRQDRPWITHLSLFRPHPPFVAPAPYNAMYSPEDIFSPTGHPSRQLQAEQHPFLAEALSQPRFGFDGDLPNLMELVAGYYGLMTEVDDNLGRLFEFLQRTNQWDQTLIIFTSDHGEQLGDHWLCSKLGFYDQSYLVPLIIRDPRKVSNSERGKRVVEFTESVDIMPTMLDWLSLEIPSQCDGYSLLPFIQQSRTPPGWRSEAHWEYDFRNVKSDGAEIILGMTPHQCHLGVIRSKQYKYVHFAALPPLLFDLQADPSELNNLADNPDYQSVINEMQGKMLDWRMRYTQRGLTDTIYTSDGPVTWVQPVEHIA
ncbi:MAG: alkaline phosphatase family protein [Pseudomonadota bacterium]